MNPQLLAEAASRAMWENDSASQALGMELIKVSPGHAEILMKIRADMTNGHKTCHGGFIFSLADSAFAFACNSHNQKAVAHHCSITYIAPAFEADSLTACANEISRSGRSGIYDITITNQSNEIIAHFRGHSRTIKGVHVALAD